jgi:hypothetical protein
VLGFFARTSAAATARSADRSSMDREFNFDLVFNQCLKNVQWSAARGSQSLSCGGYFIQGLHSELYQF